MPDTNDLSDTNDPSSANEQDGANEQAGIASGRAALFAGGVRLGGDAVLNAVLGALKDVVVLGVDRLVDEGKTLENMRRLHSVIGSFAGSSAMAGQKPAVPIEESVKSGYIVCLEDGKRFAVLSRHLKKLGMTPEQYRIKWGLPPDYPMVCADYSHERSQVARAHKLGKPVKAGAGK